MIEEDIDGASTQNNSNDPEPVLYMGNERFTVPEVLFHPSDVGELPGLYRRTIYSPANLMPESAGLSQGGLADTIAESIASLPEDLRGLFWANIGLVGGNFNIPGIEERL
jgi:actin-related protein 6